MDALLAVNWLIRLRWCAAAGQAALVLGAVFGFGLSLSLFPIFLTILAGAASNLFLHFKAAAVGSSRSRIGLIVLFDIFVLTILLHLSGGAMNPFSIMYLVYVVLAALLLGRTWTWGMAIAASLCFGVLFFDASSPASGHAHHGASGDLMVHLQGMWIAFVIVTLLSTYFLTKITDALKERDQKLHDIRLLALNQEKLASLTTLAAGAAHELGTPLGTIAVVAGELERMLDPQSAAREDVELIRAEVMRCKEIVQRMAGNAGEINGEMPQPVVLGELVKELEKNAGGRLMVSLPEKPAQITIPKRAVLDAVGALIRNAFDVSASGAEVQLNITESAGQAAFCVKDRGGGMAPEVLAKLGQPFFTTKATGRGMGLGVFLARLIAERLGGSVRFQSVQGKGTEAVFSIPCEIDSASRAAGNW